MTAKHGVKVMTIKNKTTGRVETISSNHTWVNTKKEIVRIKKNWLESDYKVLEVNLYG